MTVGFYPSRRRTSRLDAAGNVSVYWESAQHRDVSRVRDLSTTGLFLETKFRMAKGDVLHLHFLVEEGQIRADAEVRHADTGVGLGLKIDSVSSQDVPQLSKLLKRLRIIGVNPLARSARSPSS